MVDLEKVKRADGYRVFEIKLRGGDDKVHLFEAESDVGLCAYPKKLTKHQNFEISKSWVTHHDPPSNAMFT
jgi:hypothetical protein